MSRQAIVLQLLNELADEYQVSRAQYIAANNAMVDAYNHAGNVLDRLRAEILGDERPPRRLKVPSISGDQEGGDD